MCYRTLCLFLFSFCLFESSYAQATDTYQVSPADVSSIDAIIDASYDVISGAADEPRNWDRERALFHPESRHMPTRYESSGAYTVDVMDVDGFIERADPFFKKAGFYEYEIARKTEQFGNIAHVLSTYAWKNEIDGPVGGRGINSFQLLYDGTRWWIMSVFWQQESEQHPIPAAYLPTQANARHLFNGHDLTGWHADVPAADSLDVPPSFFVRNGNLVSAGEPRGHLITDEVFQNYRLEVEYRFTGEPGNCGVLVHASTPRSLYKMFPKSIEVQMMHENAGDFWVIVEDIEVPNMVDRRGPEDTWGIVEGKARRILNLTDDSENALGEWNTMVIETVDNKLRVWLNGDLVNDGFNATVQSGQIALQAEGAEVEFRKVLLTQIDKLSPH